MVRNPYKKDPKGDLISRTTHEEVVDFIAPRVSICWRHRSDSLEGTEGQPCLANRSLGLDIQSKHWGHTTIYVYIYMCMYVCMYVCKYVSM